MKLVRAVATIGGYTGLSRIFGLAREILMSHILGANILTDAFLVAFKFPNFFRRLFAEGALHSAFVPTFSHRLENHGHDMAKVTAEHVFSALTTILVIFVAAVLVFTPQITPLLAPGFAPEGLQLAIDFTRITFPYILFISLTALLTGILNTLDRFAAGAAAPILLNVVMILALIISPFLQVNAGYTLSFAVLVSGILQFLWLYVACWRAGVRLKLRWPKLSQDVRDVMRLMAPGAFGAGVMQINLFVDMLLASLLPAGSLSYLHYADRLNQLPLSIFGIAIGTALLPSLAKYLNSGNISKAMKTQESALQLALQLSLPSTVGLVILATPLISLIYGNGKFGSEQVMATAPALAAFAIGLPAYVIGKVLTANFFAYRDTKTPVKIATTCVVVNILLSFIFMKPFLHVGMALATSLSAWVQVVLLYTKLKSFDRIQVTAPLRSTFVRTAITSLIMGGCLFFMNEWLQFPHSLEYQLIKVSILILYGLVLFMSIGLRLRAFAMSDLRQSLRR